MKSIELLKCIKHLINRWGINKTITIVCLDIFALSISTCIGVNMIPDSPEKLKEENN